MSTEKNNGEAAGTSTGPKDAIRPRSPRRRVLKSGIVCFNNRYSTLPCAVRDISDTGAKISSPNAINIPDTFELHIDLDGLWVQCQVIWRRGDTVGVRFTTAPVVEEPKRKQVVTITNVPSLRPTLRRVGK